MLVFICMNGYATIVILVKWNVPICMFTHMYTTIGIIATCKMPVTRGLDALVVDIIVCSNCGMLRNREDCCVNTTTHSKIFAIIFNMIKIGETL